VGCKRIEGYSKTGVVDKYHREKGTEEICIPDGVVGSESNPLRHRAVLLLRLGKLLLGTERLVALRESKWSASWCFFHFCPSDGYRFEGCKRRARRAQCPENTKANMARRIQFSGRLFPHRGRRSRAAYVPASWLALRVESLRW
jgi:hypothetical protein